MEKHEQRKADKMTRIYYGMTTEETRPIYATVTGQMSDNTLVYTEIKQDEQGAIITDAAGDPVLILSNQYTRHTKHGTQTFTRI